MLDFPGIERGQLLPAPQTGILINPRLLAAVSTCLTVDMQHGPLQLPATLPSPATLPPPLPVITSL